MADEGAGARRESVSAVLWLPRHERTAIAVHFCGRCGRADGFQAVCNLFPGATEYRAEESVSWRS